jgi:hypothetical protein
VNCEGLSLHASISLSGANPIFVASSLPYYAVPVWPLIHGGLQGGRRFSAVASRVRQGSDLKPSKAARSRSSDHPYFVVATTLGAGTGAAFRARAFLKHCVR